MSARISSVMTAAAIVALGLGSAPAQAFNILAELNTASERACTFCANHSTTVGLDVSEGFSPADPVVPPGTQVNSEIVGHVRVDLASGSIRGLAHAASYGNLESHTLRFAGLMEEGITISLPAGLPASERVVTFIGSVHAGAATVGVATIESIYSLTINGQRVAAAMQEPGVWHAIDGEGEPGVTTASFSNGMRFTIQFPIPLTGDFLIESQLEGTAFARGDLSEGVGVATVNAGNTATLQMILPAGATFASSSGVFLTAPVPEPHTWLLMLAGVGVVAHLARRRRQHGT
jgi:hypothetical protein